MESESNMLTNTDQPAKNIIILQPYLANENLLLKGLVKGMVARRMSSDCVIKISTYVIDPISIKKHLILLVH